MRAGRARLGLEMGSRGESDARKAVRHGTGKKVVELAKLHDGKNFPAYIGADYK